MLQAYFVIKGRVEAYVHEEARGRRSSFGGGDADTPPLRQSSYLGVWGPGSMWGLSNIMLGGGSEVRVLAGCTPAFLFRDRTGKTRLLGGGLVCAARCVPTAFTILRERGGGAGMQANNRSTWEASFLVSVGRWGECFPTCRRCHTLNELEHQFLAPYPGPLDSLCDRHGQPDLAQGSTVRMAGEKKAEPNSCARSAHNQQAVRTSICTKVLESCMYVCIFGSCPGNLCRCLPERPALARPVRSHRGHRRAPGHQGLPRKDGLYRPPRKSNTANPLRTAVSLSLGACVDLRKCVAVVVL